MFLQEQSTSAVCTHLELLVHHMYVAIVHASPWLLFPYVAPCYVAHIVTKR